MIDEIESRTSGQIRSDDLISRKTAVGPGRIMVDETRVYQMAREYNMNPSLARKLLEQARDVPALRIGRRYRDMTGGDAGGEAYSSGLHRRLRTNKRDRSGHSETEEEA